MVHHASRHTSRHEWTLENSRRFQWNFWWRTHAHAHTFSHLLPHAHSWCIGWRNQEQILSSTWNIDNMIGSRVVLVLLLSVIVHHVTDAGRFRSLVRQGGRVKRSSHLCGSQLTDMLERVCGAAGIYGGKRKRLTQDPLAEYRIGDKSQKHSGWDQLTHNDLSEPIPSFIFIERSRTGNSLLPSDRSSEQDYHMSPGAFSLFENEADSAGNNLLNAKRNSVARQRRSPGIVEECCYNACSLNTLTQYCN